MRQPIREAETVCHFSIWHDAATIANYENVLFLIQNMYHPAVYYTNTEWHVKYPNQGYIQKLFDTIIPVWVSKLLRPKSKKLV